MTNHQQPTTPPTALVKVIQQMMKHPLTDVGLKRFLDDWEKSKALLVKEPAMA